MKTSSLSIPQNEGVAGTLNLPLSEGDFSPAYPAKVLSAVFVICFLATLFSGVISMLMSVYLPVAVKDLLGNVSDEKMSYVSAVINSVFIFGWMFGGIAWGVICDRAGRSLSLILSIACFGIFALLTAFTHSWVLVCTWRFLSGFGIGGVMVTTTILVSELWNGKKKAIIMGIVSVAMPIGFFIAGAINNLVPDWRDAFFTGALPLVLALVAIMLLPESIVWKNNRHVKGLVINNNHRLFSPQYRKNLWAGSIIFGTMLIGLWAIFSWAPTWVESISVSRNVQQQRGLAIMILASGGLAGSFASGWIVNALGLSKTMMMCFAACFIMTFIVFKLNTAVTPFTFVEMAVLAFFFGISQGALAVYIPSLFPPVVGASATGFCFNAGRLFTGTVVFFYWRPCNISWQLWQCGICFFIHFFSRVNNNFFLRRKGINNL